jgi:hypothetical protein
MRARDPKPNPGKAVAGLLQRTCACGQHTAGGGECEECRGKWTGTLQRAAVRPPGEAPPILAAFPGPRFGQDFSRVPLRNGPVLQRKAVSQNPGLPLSTEQKVQRCDELLKGITTKREEEALLDILRTLPSSEIGNLVARHGRKRFLRNFSFERRREAEALTLTDADLQDPEILAWLKSLRKPERYFKYNLHPAVRDHLEKLIRLREITTPLEAGQAELSGTKDVKLNVNNVEVTVKQDKEAKASGRWKKGATNNRLFVVPMPNNGEPEVHLEIATSYGERADRGDTAGYGRGTTKKDEEAGNTSLGFHEGHHGLDAMDYLRLVPLPTSNWHSGMKNADYQTELNRHQAELNKYKQGLDNYTELKTDCPGTPKDSARCAVLRRIVPKDLQQ